MSSVAFASLLQPSGGRPPGTAIRSSISGRCRGRSIRVRCSPAAAKRRSIEELVWAAQREPHPSRRPQSSRTRTLAGRLGHLRRRSVRRQLARGYATQPIPPPGTTHARRTYRRPRREFLAPSPAGDAPGSNPDLLQLRQVWERTNVLARAAGLSGSRVRRAALAPPAQILGTVERLLRFPTKTVAEDAPDVLHFARWQRRQLKHPILTSATPSPAMRGGRAGANIAAH